MAHILYLEDEVWQVKNTIIMFLEKGLGHTVVTVNSLKAAIERLSNEHFDAALIDIMLGVQKDSIDFDKSGLWLVHLIKEGKFEAAGNTPEMLVIIASGVGNMSIMFKNGTKMNIEEKAQSLGIPPEHFLRKPFLVEEVNKVLGSVLGD